MALLILIDPLSLLSDSFWLSILAVASLILWYQYFPLSRFLNDEYRKKSQNLTACGYRFCTYKSAFG